MNKTLSLLGVAFVLGTISTACEKIDDFGPDSIRGGSSNPFEFTGVCLNKDAAHGPQQSSPFTNQVWHDEFNGPRDDEDPSCYTREPTCATRLDWFGGEIPCPKDTNLAQLSMLNKCNWTLWDGYSFWGESQGSSFQNYHPNQIRIDPNGSGSLVLTARVNRNLKDLKCGWNQKYQWDQKEFQMTDCPVTSGGLDSNPRAAPLAPGRNIRYGRVEVSASIPNKVGIYPAIWMWSASTGPEYAHPYLNAKEDYSKYPSGGEHDIMEAALRNSGEFKPFQTYHSWGNDQVGGEHTKQGTDIELKTGTFYSYGVERRPEGLYFYVDNCYTQFLPKEAKDWKGREIYQNDLASFVMMNLTIIRDMISVTNFKPGTDGTWTRTKEGPLTGNFQQVDGAQMAIDYVRFFESPTPLNPTANATNAVQTISQDEGWDSESSIRLESVAKVKLDETSPSRYQLRYQMKPSR